MSYQTAKAGHTYTYNGTRIIPRSFVKNDPLMPQSLQEKWYIIRGKGENRYTVGFYSINDAVVYLKNEKA